MEQPSRESLHLQGEPPETTLQESEELLKQQRKFNTACKDPSNTATPSVNNTPINNTRTTDTPSNNNQVTFSNTQAATTETVISETTGSRDPPVTQPVTDMNTTTLTSLTGNDP